MNPSVNKMESTVALALIATAFAAATHAQKPDASRGAVVASGPGKAAIVRAAQVSARGRRHRPEHAR
ncbi:MAG: hypothetical protein IPN24_18055 [Betaproteobacteria bacterium]|nr:hypothetical protein [Betaproteobacteria bacterium]